MKVSKFMVVALLFATVLCNYSCKKGDPGEDGAAGTTGAAGPAGAAGAAGAKGTDGAKGATGPQGPAGVAGNANVKQYTYQSVTFTTLKDFVIPNISQSKIDSSLIIAYYMPSGSTAWYEVGGPGPNENYSTRYFVWPATSNSFYFTVRVLTINNTSAYTNAVTFTKFRIIIATASSIVNARKQGQPPLDVTDYESVRKYYSLPE